MPHFLENVHSPLFDGIQPGERNAILRCIGYHIRSYQRGETISMEKDSIRNIGLLLSGMVDVQQRQTTV